MLLSMNIGFVMAQESAFVEIDDLSLEKTIAYSKSDMFVEEETDVSKNGTNLVVKIIGGALMIEGLGFVVFTLINKKKIRNTKRNYKLGAGSFALGAIFIIAESAYQKRNKQEQDKKSVTFNVGTSGVGFVYGF